MAKPRGHETPSLAPGGPSREFEETGKLPARGTAKSKRFRRKKQPKNTSPTTVYGGGDKFRNL